ncbi:hypothetical protein LIER_30042 [Lithospermum erythrorhizon]|uniref:DUF7610 domain-containing protein n=1 Tax=Lithospermum erythrorhizon TaxID=34254 RepID=A0AAV3RMC5_LITER
MNSLNVLQDNLEELESEISYLYTCPLEDSYNDLLSVHIKQHFKICNNLLSKEMSSKSSDPSVLQPFIEKIDELQRVFSRWEESRNSANNNNNNQEIGGHDLVVRNHGDHDDDANDSISTCDEESNVDDDGHVMSDKFAGFKIHNVPKEICDALETDDEKAPHGTVKIFKHGDYGNVGTMRKNDNIGVYGKYIGIFVSGMILGSVTTGSVIFTLLEDSGITYYHGGLTPT